MSDSVIIMGPTAVGKSDVAVLVAERLGGEIVSADSMQIYRGLDIGTAKPPAEQLARVPHHMIDVADPSEDYSVAKYRRAAGEVINAIFERKRVPVIVGGTGLYLHSLLYDMDFGGTKGDAAARAEYERLAAERGAAYVHGLLAERDPEAAAKIHPNNLKRVIRALERVKGTHNLIHSAGDDRIKEASDGIKSTDPVIARSEATKQSIEISASVDRRLRRFAPLAMTEKMFAHNLAYKPFGFDLRRSDLMDPALFLLTRERAELVRRIDARVDAMLRAGLVAETEGLARRGLTKEHIALLGIGYKELLGYLNGEYCLDEATELIKIHTRRYAKRQMTWMKRYEDARVLALTTTSESEAVVEIASYAEQEGA